MAVDFHQPGQGDLSINLTPLIDIIFQLLVFFMLSSSFLYPSVDLKLPKGKVEQGSQAEQQLIVSLNDSGQLFLNNDLIEISNLKVRLTELLKESVDKAVYFRGDQKLHYEKFFEVMQISNQAGASNFHLLHEPSG